MFLGCETNIYISCVHFVIIMQYLVRQKAAGVIFGSPEPKAHR